PGQFTTQLKAGAERATVMIIYKRADSGKEEKPPKDAPKLTQEQMDQAIEKELKKMQGLWLRENREQNGREPYWTPSFDAIYIEKTKYRDAQRNGELRGEGGEFRIDPTKSPTTIDFTWRTDKYLAIYK